MAEANAPPTNLAGLDPKEQNEVLERVGKEYAERYKADQEALFKDGALTFAAGKPAATWQDYMRRTLVDDIPLIMDPDYLAKRRHGQAPPLLAERLMQERVQAIKAYEQGMMMAEEAGMPPPMEPQLPPKPPQLWPGLLPFDLSNGAQPFNDHLFQLHQAEFRRLMDAEVKKEQEAAIGPVL